MNKSVEQTIKVSEVGSSSTLFLVNFKRDENNKTVFLYIFHEIGCRGVLVVEALGQLSTLPVPKPCTADCRQTLILILTLTYPIILRRVMSAFWTNPTEKTQY